MVADPRSDLLTAAETAARIGVKASTLSIWRTTGRYALPFVKAGRLVRYRRQDVERWLESRIGTSTL